MNSRSAAIVLLILAVFTVPRPANAADAVLQQAESTAVQYMKAFFAADMRTVVALTHPDVFRKFGRQFAAALDHAEAQGKGQQFLRSNGLNVSVEQARTMSVERLYAAVIEANNMRAPQRYRDEMKDAPITVAKGRLVNASTALVMLRVGTPAGDRNGTLELKLRNDKWLVAGNGKNF